MLITLEPHGTLDQIAYSLILYAKPWRGYWEKLKRRNIILVLPIYEQVLWQITKINSHCVATNQQPTCLMWDKTWNHHQWFSSCIMDNLVLIPIIRGS